MSIRESIIRSLYSSDLEWHEYESSIDRIAAFAHGSKLGRLLWRWKYGLEDWRAKAVLSETLRKAQRRLQINERHKEHGKLFLACQQALVEWYFDKCKVCKGVSELMIGDRRVVCKYCQGTAAQRWSRKARAHVLGPEELDKWEKRLGEIHIILGAADGYTAAESMFQLERAT